MRKNNNNSMFNRAQGTLEYLLIIGVIIVISLMVVGLLTGFLGAGGGVNEQQSKLFWSAQPIAIIDGIVDADGNGIFVLRNNEPDDNNVFQITVDGTAHLINSGAGRTLGNGQKYSVTLNNLTPCTSTSSAYSISISYVSQRGITKNTETHGYVVFCTTQITTSSSSGGGVSFDVTGDPENGSLIVSDGSTGWNATSIADSNAGIIIDGNMMCMDGAKCDQYIDWNGTDIIFSSSAN